MPRPAWCGRKEQQLIAEAQANGTTMAEVGLELGRTRAAVRMAAYRRGVRTKHGGWNRDVDARTELLACVRRGATNCGQISRAMGRDHALVLRWVRELEQAGALRRTGRSKGMRIYLVGEWAK